MVHTPWDSVFVLLYDPTTKRVGNRAQQLSRPKGTVHPYRTSSNANVRQRFVNWTTLFPTCCSHSDFSSTLLLPCNKYCRSKGALGLILNDFPRQFSILLAKTHLWASFYMYCSVKSTLDHISSVWCKIKLMWEPLTNLQEMLLKLLQLYCDTALMRYLVILTVYKCTYCIR